MIFNNNKESRSMKRIKRMNFMHRMDQEDLNPQKYNRNNILLEEIHKCQKKQRF